MPNFRNFDFKDRVVYGEAVPAGVLGWVTLYAAAYVGIVLALGLASFRRRTSVSVRLALGLAVLVPLVPWSQSRIDRLGGGFRAQEDVLYVWSGEQVKRLLPGFEMVAADLYWLRTVQYFGGQRRFQKNKRFELLRPLAEITVTLDPRLEIAYRYGAVFLSENPPIGAGRPREGIELLEKGTRNLPRSWRLWQEMGFFHFLFLHDAHRAADILNRAAEIPGAAFWLRTLAADLAAKGGDRSSGPAHVAADVRPVGRGSHQGERPRPASHVRLPRRRRPAERAGAANRAAHRLPRPSTGGARESRLWRGPLNDATGVPFRYDASTGRVSIAQESRLWRPE